MFGSRKVATFERMPADSPRKRSRDDASSDSGEETEVDEEPAPAPAPAPAGGRRAAPAPATRPAVAASDAAPRRRYGGKYCVIAFVADDAFAALDARAAELCDRRVHEHCYQQRAHAPHHAVQESELTPTEAAQVYLETPPPLPFNVELTTFFNWNTCLALQVGRGSAAIRSLQSRCAASHPGGKRRCASRSTSMYRLRGMSAAVAKPSFERVRRQCSAQLNIRGSRRGHRDQEARRPYFPPSCRMLPHV